MTAWNHNATWYPLKHAGFIRLLVEYVTATRNNALPSHILTPTPFQSSPYDHSITRVNSINQPRFYQLTDVQYLSREIQLCSFDRGLIKRTHFKYTDRLLDNLVVECWLRVREGPGSIPSQGPRHTKDVIKMVPVVPIV